jgi:hypothetical protein
MDRIGVFDRPARVAWLLLAASLLGSTTGCRMLGGGNGLPTFADSEQPGLETYERGSRVKVVVRRHGDRMTAPMELVGTITDSTPDELTLKNATRTEKPSATTQALSGVPGIGHYIKSQTPPEFYASTTLPSFDIVSVEVLRTPDMKMSHWPLSMRKEMEAHEQTQEAAMNALRQRFGGAGETGGVMQASYSPQQSYSPQRSSGTGSMSNGNSPPVAPRMSGLGASTEYQPPIGYQPAGAAARFGRVPQRPDVNAPPVGVSRPRAAESRTTLQTESARARVGAGANWTPGQYRDVVGP